jgi:hypothetical protein
VSPQEEGSFWDITAADLDEDGALDILASSLDGGGIKAWKNAGLDTWEVIPGRFPSSGSFYDLAIADINQDGYDDICAASLGEGIKFWKGRGGAVVGHVSERKKQFVAPAGEAALETQDENSVYTTVSGFPEYKLGPGDVIELTLWQGTTANKEQVLVRPEGKISFGFVEDLYVKGLTPNQLDELLTEHFKEYVKQPLGDGIKSRWPDQRCKFKGSACTPQGWAIDSIRS